MNKNQIHKEVIGTVVLINDSIMSTSSSSTNQSNFTNQAPASASSSSLWFNKYNNNYKESISVANLINTRIESSR
jgi:hypothetical protein